MTSPKRPTRTSASSRPPSIDESIKAYFDRELTEGARDQLFRLLARDPKRCEDVARTQRMISMLREQAPAPDLTDRIMAGVERRRPFLSPGVRLWVKRGRWGSLAAASLVLLGVAILWRTRPDLRLTPVPTPMASVVESSEAAAREAAQRFENALQPFRAAPLQAEPRASRGVTRIEDVSALPMAPAAPASVPVLASMLRDEGWQLPTGAGDARLASGELRIDHSRRSTQAWSLRVSLPGEALASHGGQVSEPFAGLVFSPTMHAGTDRQDVCESWPEGESPRRVLLTIAPATRPATAVLTNP